MKILGLDISTNTGYAALEDDVILSLGNITSEKKKIADYGNYPLNYYLAAEEVANKIVQKIDEVNPDVIVIEETNKQPKFSSRYSTKILEFIHCLLLASLKSSKKEIVYLSTGDWRRSAKIKLTKEQKKINAEISKLRREQKKAEEESALAQAQGQEQVPIENKEIVVVDSDGNKIKGKITNKHLAVKFVNAKFGLNFKQKDNDIAEAICLVEAYKNGCKRCDGIF